MDRLRNRFQIKGALHILNLRQYKLEREASKILVSRSQLRRLLEKTFRGMKGLDLFTGYPAIGKYYMALLLVVHN